MGAAAGAAVHRGGVKLCMISKHCCDSMDEDSVPRAKPVMSVNMAGFYRFG